MRFTLRATMLVGALALPVATVVAAAPMARHQTKALSATGTIEKVDQADKTITLKTPKGEETFKVADSTMIHHGSKTATLAQLSSWDGQPAKVRFTEAAGVRTASSVMVGSARHHSPKAQSASAGHPAATPK